MAATITRKRGETIRLKITVTVNDVAQDLTQYSGILFIIYYKTNKVFAKYSREELEGYNSDDFEVIQAGTGEDITDMGRFDIHIQQDLTLTANQDAVLGEIKVKMEDDDWDDGVWHRIKDGIELFTFQDSKTKAD